MKSGGLVDTLPENSVPWIPVSDLQKDNAAAKAYAINGVPRNFLIAPIGLARTFSIPSSDHPPWNARKHWVVRNQSRTGSEQGDKRACVEQFFQAPVHIVVFLHGQSAKRQRLSIVLVQGLLYSDLRQWKKSWKFMAIQEDTLLAGQLETRLALTGNITADSLPLSFTVINHADTAMRFCKWETPFEPHLGKYFEVMEDNGNEAPFKGAMARRVMPPPPEVLSLKPHLYAYFSGFNCADAGSVLNNRMMARKQRDW